MRSHSRPVLRARSLITRGRHPDNEQKNRDVQFAPKMARSPSRAGGQRTRLQLTGKGRNHPPRRCRLRTSKSSVRDHVSSVLPRMCGDRWQCSRNGRVSRRNEYRQQYKKRKENCVKQNSAHGVRSPGHDVSLLPAGASPVVMRGIYEVRRVVCDLVHIVRHFSLPDGIGQFDLRGIVL